MTNRVCSIAGCDAPHKARGMCGPHYESHHKRHTRAHRHRPDRRLKVRAANRALTALARRHPEEYQQLCDEHYKIVVAEAAKVKARTGNELSKLKPGPRAYDEQPEDRARLEQERCATCQTYHAAGHRCPTCSVITRVDTVGDVPHAQYREFLTAENGV